MFRPPPAELMACLDLWERFLHDDALPPLVHAALAHAQFEAIHPFFDGNGRVGRLLITLLLVERDIMPSPLLYLSDFFEATREEYYARLLGVTERGEWEEWLIYFLRGVALQSQDAVARIRQIDGLFLGWKQELDRGRSQLPPRALELFAENPFWQVSGVAARLEVAFYDRPARPRPAGGGGHHCTSWPKTAPSRVLCGAGPQHLGGAAPPCKVETSTGIMVCRRWLQPMSSLQECLRALRYYSTNARYTCACPEMSEV